MKFTCNNCGFSAEVPDVMKVCPMCASDNVSLGEEKKSPEKQRETKDTDQISAQTQQDVPEQQKKSTEDGNVQQENKKKAEKKITLNDEFFDEKPNKDQEEIANIIKELYPESESEKKEFKLPPNFGIISGVAGAVILIVVVLIFVFTGKAPEKDLPEKDISEKMADIVEPEEKVQPVEEPLEKLTETVKTDDSEKAEEMEEIEKDTEVAVKERKPEAPRERKVSKQRAPARQKAVKKPAPVKRLPPEKKPAAAPPPPAETTSPAPPPKPKPKPSTAELFNKHLQAGHTAISERRFKEALNEYVRASKISPSNASVYKFLGITYAHLQNQKEACTNYKRYIQLAPNAKDRAQVEELIKACP